MARDRTQRAFVPAWPAAAGAAWRKPLRAAWRALWLSRAVVWVAGVTAIAVSGVHGNAERFDPEGLTRPFGAVGDALVGPGARWDAVWFLEIADDGYAPADERAAFFPLYPLLVRIAGTLAGSAVVGGILVSLACLLAGLVLLHRLVALDWGDEVARTCVLLVACFPGAVYFSAVYSEALFLAVSVAAVYAARTGRWELAALAGVLATATRSAGMVLLVPLALLWWRAWRAGEARPADAAWLVLVPAGLAAFCVLLAIDGGNAFGPFHAQESWMRSFAGPFVAVAQGADAAWDGARQIVEGTPRPTEVFDGAAVNVGLFATLVAVLVALAGALRRLPAAYSLYALAALALPLSYPVDGQPLMSLPRFVAVLWPLHLWLALWLRPRGDRARHVAVGLSLAGLALVSWRVARWGWVA